MDADDSVREYLDAHTPLLLDRLAEWVRIPSVAGVPERKHHLTRSANWLAGELRGAGFPITEIWEGAEGPAVFAEWSGAPGAPTILIYSHHDVRAVKDENWDQTSPFDPVLRDGRLYGRGSSDAKGQVMAHVWGIRAHLDATGRTAPDVNLKLIVEGEEEAGSPGLADLLQAHRARLDADAVVFSDTLLWRAEHPAICTSIRGMLGAHLEVYGPFTDIHSGAVSGAAPNPALELSRLLAQLHDQKGRITFPGFYDDVEEISQRRRAELAALPFDPQDWLERSHTRSIVGEEGYTVLERLWERPALEVIALAAGDPIGVKRAAVPSMASADLSIRTVSGQSVQDVADQVRRWVKETISDGYSYELSLDTETAQEFYRTPDSRVLDSLSTAMTKGFQSQEVGRMGNAGGGPADLLSSALKVPVVFFGTGLVEDNWHDSDESVRVDILKAGAATLAFLWEELGRPD
ncbi:M20/M25/M40 family metallo-hydrolase [Pseudarthrobacter sp. MM222]|uniref:M20/M25/M40 family metallo-hydrolase n=1 Tax=Pseudarthrobacter sp. MM222 TaxID=3018929 RepID=UPI00221F32A7|nr:M20/M25/M40 family metallo-hydrolase [Pseudarthrobacter sp. MM222]CAI3800482.1 Succinyl-diaminopimelate desuccinylase [Pseudarthrobacter sp. MM222]